MSQATVKAEDLPYRPCVGVMILNRDGLVWAGRRISDGNSEYDGSPQLWQMPQGASTRARIHWTPPTASFTRRPASRR